MGIIDKGNDLLRDIEYALNKLPNALFIGHSGKKMTTYELASRIRKFRKKTEIKILD